MKLLSAVVTVVLLVEMADAAFSASLRPSSSRVVVPRLGRTTVLFSSPTPDHENEQPAGEPIKPDILLPYLPAADPMYPVRGPVGLGEFVISRSGEPTAEELSNENLLRILKIKSTDLEVNTLVWKCLGYRLDEANEVWTSEKVFPKWGERFPTPPDLIGMRREYSKEIDRPSLKANQALVKSVPVDNKQSLKTHLKPLGFTGYKYAELTPNKTRRAQCANWILYFREELFGFTIEELQERKRLKKDAAAAEEMRLEAQGIVTEDVWKPPVTEVF